MDFAKLEWNEEKTRELAIKNNLEDCHTILPMKSDLFRNNIFTYKNEIFQFDGFIMDDGTSSGDWI